MSEQFPDEEKEVAVGGINPATTAAPTIKNDTPNMHNPQLQLEQRLEQLERDLAEVRSMLQITDIFPVLPGNASNGNQWQQLVVNGGSLTNLGAAAVGTDILGCTATGSPSSLLTLADGQGLVIEQEDSSDMRYLWMPNPAFGVYLTNNTAGGYDVYSDSGHAIQLASNQSPEPSSGLFQWNGSTGRLIIGNASFFPVRVLVNGEDGAGNPLYDLYPINIDVHSIPSGTTPLNTSGPVAPICSRARFNPDVVSAGVIVDPDTAGHPNIGQAVQIGSDVVLYNLPEDVPTGTDCGG